MSEAMKPIAFHLQDPSAPGRTLLDALAEAGHGAERGGGIFAFASAQGVAALLDDPVIEPLSNTGGFDLVVGMDAITGTRALAVLADRSKRRPGLTARLFIHGLPTLFHPKLCWFARSDGFTLIVGSGNLTPGGLTSNFEAFTVATLEGSRATDAAGALAAWLARWDERLFAPDSPEALERAEKNSGAERSLKQPMAPASETAADTLPVPENAEALVLEVPRNALKRTQLDVGLAHFTDFFGGEPGKQKRLSIQHVEDDGSLAPVEPPRALISTTSRNYRFEAAAGRGLDYPEQGRPIGVFLRMPDGIFRYRLLWPGTMGHAQVEAFLTERTGPSGRRIRREASTAAELRKAWPSGLLV